MMRLSTALIAATDIKNNHLLKTAKKKQILVLTNTKIYAIIPHEPHKIGGAFLKGRAEMAKCRTLLPDTDNTGVGRFP